MQADFSAIQFHADQALLAQQLAETSTARARALRTRLVTKLRRLYESDHKRAAASAFAVDEATTIALEGLLGNPAPLTDDRSTFLIDQLLLHANPDVFESGHPSTSATYPCNTVPYNMNHRTGTVYLYNMVPPNSLDS